MRACVYVCLFSRYGNKKHSRSVPHAQELGGFTITQMFSAERDRRRYNTRLGITLYKGVTLAGN